MTSAANDLDAIIALRELSAAAIFERLAMPPYAANEHRAYERLSDVTHVHRAEAHPAHFYLRGVELVMVYIGDDDFLAPLTLDVLHARLGESVTLRSRQGKRAHQHVWAEQGVACSELDGALGFLEVFPPISHERYLETIYDEPLPFIR